MEMASCHEVIYISYDEPGSRLHPPQRSTPPRRLQERLQAAERRRTRVAASSAPASWAVDWTSLPEEILCLIFSYLDVCSLIQVGQSAKTWRRVSQDQYLGSTLDFSQFKSRLYDEHFQRILDCINAPRLKTINLHGCTNVTGKAIARIADKCPGVVSLDLSGCLAVTNFALYCLFTHEPLPATTPQPPPLVLPNGRLPSRSTLLALQWQRAQCNQWNRGEWRALPALTVLRLSYCSNVGDQAVEWILRHCPVLEELSLSGCSRITDRTCQHLLAAGRRLRAASKTTDTATATAADVVPGVRTLDLTGCLRLTIEGLAALLGGLASLTRLDAPPCLGRWDMLTDARLWLGSGPVFAQVEVLGLSGAVVKEDVVTYTLPRRFPNLVVLDLSGSQLLGGQQQQQQQRDGEEREARRVAEAWAAMLVGLPRLRDVDLRACAGVRHDVLADLQAAFPLGRLTLA